MRTMLVLVLCVLAAGSVTQAGPPTPFSPAVGEHNYVPGGRQLCWSEPADLADAKISSEIIAMYGLESEIVNDFIVGYDATVGTAYGYGGYYNWAPGDPPITSLNWKFYDDGGCVPNNLLSVWNGLGAETFIGYDGYGYPTYRYEMNTNQQILGNNLYWFGLQAADHPFPPQWGRQGAGAVTNCDSLFKSAFFAYPDWTPAGDLIGAPFDAAQEIDCYGGIVPVQETSWGAVRGLFR